MNTPSVTPLTDHLYTKASRRLIPLSGTFELSPVCNFDCRMCYVRKSPQEVKASPRPILTLEDWRRIAREAREAGMLFLLLTGGEPFLWKDFWKLYEELIAMGFLISINTNGSLIDEDAVRRLTVLPPRRVNITLYGASDETYAALCGVKGVFSKVDRAINALKNAGIPVKLNCSLTPHNVHDLEEMVRYAEDRKLILDVTSYMFPPIRRDESKVGVNDHRFTPEEAAQNQLRTYRLQNGPEGYARFLDRILEGYAEPPAPEEGCIDPLDGRIRCRAGKASFWITWDGWLTPCGLMPTPRTDVTGRPFRESWEELTRLSAALKLSGTCGNCPNQQLCHACAAMALAETGESTGIPQYLCRVAREMRRIAAAECPDQ